MVKGSSVKISEDSIAGHEAAILLMYNDKLLPHMAMSLFAAPEEVSDVFEGSSVFDALVADDQIMQPPGHESDDAEYND